MPESAPPEEWAARVRKVVCAVQDSIGEPLPDLPDDFGPAHLSVALIDAVFNPQLPYYERVVRIVENYCDHFGLTRLWTSRICVPPRRKQEKLTKLVTRYRVHGCQYMRERVFEANYCSPGTSVPKSDNVLRCAKVLLNIGIETIQDVREREPTEIKLPLCRIHGIGERTAHMLLMYCGHEEVVKGDVHVRNFVSAALGETDIGPAEAERLVAAAAREMDVTPRELDAQIWEYRRQGRSQEGTCGKCRHASHGGRREARAGCSEQSGERS